MKKSSHKALVIIATLLAGCSKESTTNETTSTTTTNSATATIAAKPAPPTKEPVVFVPPESESGSDTVVTLKEADERFKDYTLSTTHAKIELRDVAVSVLNKMDGFTEPKTSSTPGRFEFGGQGRKLTQDERNKVTEEVLKSTVAYLEKQLRVTKDARFEVIVVISASPGVRILNGFDPYGIEVFNIFLLDTTTKAVIWCDGRQGIGKTLAAATKVVAHGVPERLDVLFGIKK